MRIRAELFTAAQLVAGAGVAAAFNLAYLVMVARTIGPAAYADVSASLSIIFIVTVAATPISSAAARVVAANQTTGVVDVPALRRHILARISIGAAAVLVLVLPFTYPLSALLHLSTPYLLPLALACAAGYVIVSIERALLQGAGRFTEQNLNNIFEAASRLAAAALALWWRPSAIAAMVAYLIAIASAEVWFGLRWRSAEPRGDASAAASSLLQTARPLMVLMAATAVFQNGDMLAARRWLPAELAGQYGAAATITKVFGVLFVPLYVMAGPMLVVARQRGSLLAPTLRLCAYFAAVCLVPLLLLAAAGDRIVVAVYGNAYREAGAFVALQAGVVVAGYLALMAAQAHVTMADRRISPLFAGGAVLQILALALYHSSVMEILAALYVVQGALLIVTLVTLGRMRGRTEEASHFAG